MNDQAIRRAETVGENSDTAEDDGPIRACVARVIDQYLRQLRGHDCADLYRLVLTEVEPPLLEAVLDYCQGNQTRAARMLGMNRGTLRKKLVQYGIGQ